MIQLPATAGVLHTLAARNTARFAMQGIHVLSSGQSVRLEASDGHLVAILQTGVQGDECDLLIPADKWNSAYQNLAKRKGQGVLELHVGEFPCLQVVSENATTMESFTPMEGRFPNVLGILPTSKALVKTRISAGLLIRLLKAAIALCPQEEGHDGVQLLWWGDNKPIGIMTRNAELTMDGLLMPLSEPK